MTKLLALAFALIVLVAPRAEATRAAGEDRQWLLGVWELTQDPDGSPTDWMEFRADGTFSVILGNCMRTSGQYHLYQGDLFFSIEQNGKFLANGGRFNADRTKLLYTSPRTRNTATYEKVPSARCHGG